MTAHVWEEPDVLAFLRSIADEPARVYFPAIWRTAYKGFFFWFHRGRSGWTGAS